MLVMLLLILVLSASVVAKARGTMKGVKKRRVEIKVVDRGRS